MRLQGKVAIVTGGANGIGKAVATVFAIEGAHVCIADIDSSGANDVVQEIRRNGGSAVFCYADVSNRYNVEDMVGRVKETFRAIDILVNNAASFAFGTIETVTREQWLKIFSVNVLGYADCAQAVVPIMKARGGGTIINIASVSAFVAEAGHLPYSVSKAAALHMTRCLAVDLAPYNIRVNAISPGPVRTRATDEHIAALGLDTAKAYQDFGNETLMKRMGKPEEIAYGALFLASDESSFMTGANLVMDGGASID